LLKQHWGGAVQLLAGGAVSFGDVTMHAAHFSRFRTSELLRQVQTESLSAITGLAQSHPDVAELAADVGLHAADGPVHDRKTANRA